VTLYLAWLLLVIALVGLTAAGTARTILLLSQWKHKPVVDRILDWVEQRAETRRETALFRVFWFGMAIGIPALFGGLLLLLTMRD
jgi:hypothetical protein